MGSKSKIAKYILPIILKNRQPGQLFVEPFVGGCNIMDKVTGQRIGGDNNKYLIAMWDALIKGWEPPKIIERQLYNKVRDNFKKKGELFPEYLTGWVGFVGSYNGRFFSGGYSGHSVKTKTGCRDYIGEGIRNTLKQIESLKEVTFFALDYADLPIYSQSLIYCDIPYRNTTQYDISKEFNYDRFYSWCRKMKNEGHTIFISEYDMPHDFQLVWEMKSVSTINQYVTKRNIEKLFTI